MTTAQSTDSASPPPSPQASTQARVAHLVLLITLIPDGAQYNPDKGLFCTALRVSHTVIGSVFTSIAFWLFLCVHLCVFSAAHWHRDAIDGELADFFVVDWDGVTIVSGMTTFVEVFYAQQSFARYVRLYNKMKKMIRHVYELVHYVRVFIGDRARGYSRCCSRYVIASIVLTLQDMKGQGSDADLRKLGRLGFLSEMEMTSIQQIDVRNRSKVILMWASGMTRLGCQEARAPNQILRVFCDSILKIQTEQREIVETIRLPVPFQYFHLLSVMIIMNLMLWAITMGLVKSLLAPVIYFFSSFIFIGMMMLSSELCDPFGTDEVDFPVDKWMSECIDMVSHLVECEWPGGEGMFDEIAKTEPSAEVYNWDEVSWLSVVDHTRQDRPTLWQPIDKPACPNAGNYTPLSASWDHDLSRESEVRGPFWRSADKSSEAT
eukprot:CAMPEP_0204154820 /NCGR_PEP_ID=MMETSP0361-20130328/29051_1 /ASSEMBLY_ACC=CAM_ASM_000343 /TAXON_ID=268821 /ORGANISM="Scrippsiella Hangoei, Strain SHTV-5" /LENGTH=433 /DNA_ID=CAMNT_0051110157 /DNA_START=6 /DNA_END=1309 /DNA_ORIENTATION=-